MRTCHLIPVILVLAMVPGVSWCQSSLNAWVKNRHVPAGALATDPQGDLLVQVDNTALYFPPFPSDDQNALVTVIIATQAYTTGKWKDATDAERTAGVKNTLGSLAIATGPLLIASFQSTMGVINGRRTALAQRPQFVQLNAMTTTTNSKCKSCLDWAADFQKVGGTYYTAGNKVWIVDGTAKGSKLPSAAYQNDDLTAQAFTDSSCAMWDNPSVIWSAFKPGDTVSLTEYFETWLVSGQVAAVSPGLRPIGYIRWKLDVSGKVGDVKDPTTSTLAITNDDYEWVNSAGTADDALANLMRVNFPGYLQ